VVTHWVWKKIPTPLNSYSSAQNKNTGWTLAKTLCPKLGGFRGGSQAKSGSKKMKKRHSAAHKIFLSLVFLTTGSLSASCAYALSTLDDDELAEETGSGLALALDDFSFRMAPTSYIELTGTPPENTSTPAPTAAGAGWKRADVRYYGLSMTSNTAAGADWYGNGCGTGLGCPMGTGGVANFAPVYNPFMLRVFQYQGFDYQGNLMSSTGGVGGTDNRPTVLEFIGPTMSDSWRWSFWGEIEIGRGTVYSTSTAVTTTSPHPGNPLVPGCLSSTSSNQSFCGLQSQSIILGKPITRSNSDINLAGAPGRPTMLRLMQTSNSADRTLGLTYQSALSGDFRFSVAQTASSPNALHRVPDFNDLEGVHFKNVDAFIPLGRLNSQAITFNSTAVGATAGDGNFVAELTPIPKVANVYNDIYCGTATPTVVASCGTVTELTDFFGNNVVAISTPNSSTRGYVKWGCTTTDNVGVCNNGAGAALYSTAPIASATNNGIYFSNPAGTTIVNIGTAKLDGVLIQSLKLTTKGL
jgi:hypothetical protein